MYSRVLPALLIAILFLTSASLTAQDSTSVDTLVAYYPFNGNASDSSGFGNDGEVFGASLTEDRFGRSDSAYSFIRLNDEYIKSGLNDSLLKSYTVSGWYYWNGADNAHAIGTLTDSGTNDGWVWKAKDNQVFYRHGNTLLKSNSSIVSNEWFHVVLTYNDADSIASLYINGIEDINGVSATSQADSLIIGAIPKYLADFNWDGKIDDIRIYNFVLEDSAIWNLYSEDGWPLPEEVIPDTLVAYYPFSESAIDSSGFGNDGEVLGPTLTNDRFGKIDEAYSFDGVNDLIDIGMDNSLYLTDGFTFSVWAKGVSSEASITGLIASGRGYPYMLGIDDGDRLFLRVAQMDIPTNLFVEGVTTDIDTWHHYVGVFKSSEYIKIYKDGEEVGSLTESIPDSIDLPEANLWIGARHDSGDPNRRYYFNGDIDDVRIYSYALEDSSIWNLYTEGDWPPPPPPIDSTGTVTDTLVAHYLFYGNVADSSNFGNDGETFGAVLTQDRFGRMDSAYYFDGSDYIDFGSSDTIEFAREDFSISVWVKPTYSGKSQYQILRKGSDFVTYGEARWSLALDEFGKIRMVFEDADQGDSTLVLSGEKNLLDDEWHHIGVVFDRDSTLRVFVDNEEEISSEEIKGYSGYITNQEDFSLYAGRGNTGASQFSFVGGMDDIRIYSYALEDSTIGNLYSEGGWPIVIPDTLVAYYPFNGNATDSSGFGNNGEVFGASLTEDRFGNLNSAYLFNGVSDKIFLPLDFDFPERTINVWFNAENIPVWDRENNPSSSLRSIYISDHPNTEYGMTSLWVTNVEGKDNVCFHNGGADAHLENCYEIEESKWYFASITVSSTGINYYLNGELIKSREFPGNIHSVTHNGFYSAALGVGRNTDHRFFDGKLDDVRIYNYTLEDSVIWNLYSEGGWPIVIPDTLVAYYPFNGNATDSSGFENDGEVFGASLTEDRFGRVDSAYSFDGIDDYIEIPDSSILNSTVRSVEFWFKKTNSFIEEGLGNTYVEGILWKSFDTSVNRDYSFSITNQESLFDFYNTIGNSGVELFEARTVEIIEPNEWYHIVGVIDTSKTVTYINGVRKKVLVNDGSTIQSGAPISIGRASVSSLPQRYFEGVIDDVKLYNYELDSLSVWNSYTEGGWPIDSTGTSDEVNDFIPEQYLLYQNYPNPFNPSTTIKFDLPETGMVSLRVFDITGRTVATLIDGTKTAGRYQVNFNASNLASGIYLYELRTNKFSSIKKFTLIK